MTDTHKLFLILVGFAIYMTVGYILASRKPLYIQERMSTCGSASNGKFILAIGWPFMLFMKD